MRKAVKYPLVVFLIGVIVSIVIPILSHTIEPYRFGRLVGRLIAFSFIVAIFVGWLSDRKHK